MNNIGDKLKELRESNGLTRKEAVDKLKTLGIDISDKTLYGYESGRNSANADMFLALCKIYNCTNIMSTFSDSIDDVLFTNLEWHIIEKYRKLDDSGRSHVDTILQWEADRIGQISTRDSQIADLKSRSASIKEYPSLVHDPDADYLTADAAHERTDTAFTDEERKADEDMLD